ncbi:hypothetical protein LTR86_009691 [Recurvomyces mirabilis]|nr:hypothetical protein LTR86_009691 [Recurvomyces mirabilis]
MVLQILPLQYTDIPAFAALDAAAMADWGLAKAMAFDLPPGETREQWILKFTQQGFVQNDRVKWLKVVDTELEGEQMVAAALWRFQFEQEEPKAEVEVDDSAPVAEGEVKKEVKRPSVMRSSLLPIYTA